MSVDVSIQNLFIELIKFKENEKFFTLSCCGHGLSYRFRSIRQAGKDRDETRFAGCGCPEPVLADDVAGRPGDGP